MNKDVERRHKDSTEAKHLPLNEPRLKSQIESIRVIEQEKPAPVAVLSTNDKRSVISVVMGLTGHKCTHRDTHTSTHRNQTGISGLTPRQVLIKTAKPVFFPCTLLI